MYSKAISGAALLTALLSSGCAPVRNGDRALADAVQASNLLVAYYTDMATISLDGWQNDAVLAAIDKAPAPDGAPYNERLLAFRSRAELANKLLLTYQSIEAIRDPKAVNSTVSAGQNLATDLKSVPKISKESSLPSDEFGKAAASLVNLERNRDFVRALEAVAQVNQAVLKMFQNERPAYLSIASDRASSANTLLKHLKDNKLVNPGALLAGLHIGATVTISASNTDVATDAGLAIAAISAEREKLDWQCATENTLSMLTALVSISGSIRSGAPADLNPLEDSIAHANSCIKDHDTLTAPAPVSKP